MPEHQKRQQPGSPVEKLMLGTKLRRDPFLGKAAKLVGAEIIEHFNRMSGRCDPSLRRLANLLDYSMETVRRAIRNLESSGYIVVILGKGQHGANRYRPRFEIVVKAASAGAGKSAEPPAPARRAPSADARKKRSSAPEKTKYKTKKETGRPRDRRGKWRQVPKCAGNATTGESPSRDARAAAKLLQQAENNVVAKLGGREKGTEKLLQLPEKERDRLIQIELEIIIHRNQTRKNE